MVRIEENRDRRYTREEILRAFPPVEREKPQQREFHPGDCDEVRIAEAVRHIPADDRDIWLQVGMALKDELGDRGRSVWDAWSSHSDKFNAKDQEKTWRSFRRNGIGIGTLFHYAKQYGWSPPRRESTASATAAGPTSSNTTSEEAPWPQMDRAAYHGLAGEIVDTLSPHSEADPVAILIQYLTMFGNIVGNTSYYLIESDRHRANLFCVLVGTSSKGRKGTAVGRVRAITKFADEAWEVGQIASGLSSGEGLISAVRDPVKKWNPKDKVEEVVDPGVIDKRLMVIEPEFAGALSTMERHGNQLSPVIRNAWDGHRLQTLTKNSPQKADGAHISIIAHITQVEARARLTTLNLANGFGNRFGFFCVRRSKFLPHGGGTLDEAELMRLGERTKAAVEFARTTGRITMTTAAGAAWDVAYRDLSAERPGLLGPVLARADAQLIRLDLAYALPDCSQQLDIVHLEAAMAMWAYAEESAVRIFGDSLGAPMPDE